VPLIRICIRCISHHCHDGYCRKIDEKAHQSLSYDVALRQPKHEGSTQPHRKYCKLNGRRDADQVTSSGIVGTRQSRRRSDDCRNGKTA